MPTLVEVKGSRAPNGACVQRPSSLWITKFGVSFLWQTNVYVFGKQSRPHFSSGANDINNWPPNVGIQGDDELCSVVS